VKTLRRIISLMMLMTLALGHSALLFAFSRPAASHNSDDRDNHGHNRQEEKRCEDHDRNDRGDHDDCDCLPSAASKLVAQAPGASLQNPSTLLSAFTIANLGEAARKNVKITSLTVPGGSLTIPSLPFSLGTLVGNSSKALDADFIGGPFAANTNIPLTVRGTFSEGRETKCFKLKVQLPVPPAAPGSAQVNTTTAGPNTVKGAPFPHQPPAFDGDENTANWTVPTGPIKPAIPTATTTLPQKAPIGDPPAIDFVVNNDWGIGQSATAEPSGASGGGVVFVSSNWFAAFSKDGGSTFHQLDPTTIFPNDLVGFCCDQIVQYVPQIDRFIWMLQGTGYRIAMASPADIIASNGTAWTYWNLTPDIFNQAGVGFDYPDLSVGDNSLYMTWDVFGSRGGHLVARTSLAGLQAAGTIEIDYTNPSDSGNAWGSHLTQDTGNEIFWAGHDSTSQMRIYSLKEGSNTYFWQDINISSWANNSPLSSTSPDGQNWINFLMNPTTQNPGGGFPKNAVLGLTRSFNQVWFAWSAGTDNNFPRPHVEMVTINIDNSEPPHLSVAQQVQIWNPAYTFAYPALATNACTGEVGFSLEGGGDGNFENHLVGFWGDFIAYITTESNSGDTRFGDYVTIRQSPPTQDNPGNLFDAFGYGRNTVPPPGTGVQSDPHYVLFGRPASSCVVIG
jgi:hypothetical protein